MVDRITLGSVPAEEPCAQLGEPGYAEQALSECEAYKAQLVRHYKAAHDDQEPLCKIVVTSNPHDFGTYFEVAAEYDPNNQAAVTAALWFESHPVEDWDGEARAVLSQT